jgi:hypothetical protein
LGWPLPEGLPAGAIVADIEIARVAAPMPNKALRSTRDLVAVDPDGRLLDGRKPAREGIAAGIGSTREPVRPQSTFRVWTTLPMETGAAPWTSA